MADRDHRRRPGGSGGCDRARAGAGVPSPQPDPERPSGNRPQRLGPGVRADDRGDRVHGPRSGCERGGRGQRNPQADQDPGRIRLSADRGRLRRNRDRRRRRAARQRRHHRARNDAHQGADARRRRGAAPDMGVGRHEVRRRDRRRCRPHGRRGRLDAGRLACRIPAGDQPADPQRGRAAAPSLGHAVRDHRRSRACRGGARRAARPRAARRDLRVRRNAGVHDRPRLGDRPPLPRAQPPARVLGAAVGELPGREGAYSRRDRRRCWRVPAG